MATLHERKPSSDGSDIAQTHTQRTSNLARIRDNQRRSRARRKEYLQDLETKYRSCEQMGVEASAEIQAAARRVVDENRRLRALLKRQGMSDAELDGLAIEPTANPQLTQSARELETLLTTKKVCRPGGSCGPGESCTPTPTPPTSELSPSIATKQEEIGHPSPKVTQVAPRSASIPNLSPALQQFPPYSYYDAPHSHVTSPIAASAQWQQQQQQQHRLPSQPALQQQQQQQQTYGMNDDNMPPYLVDQGLQDWGTNFEQSPYMDQSSHELTSPMDDQHSCRIAAETLRSFNPALGLEAEAELGCRGAQECTVSTHQVFEILNRMQTLDSA